MTGRTPADAGQMRLRLEPERRVFRVSELNFAVQQIFESEFSMIWVAGEISGCRLATSGHTYFSLKDDQSQIKCVLFKGSARFARFKPQDGLAVIARGKLEVYEARGEYQLIVDLLEPQGAGALQIAFEQLKKKLLLEGLFDASRKRALPKLPQRIGIVTSPSGAVIRDILHVLDRRFQGIHVRLFPAQVQGEGSVDQVCAGLRFFSESNWAQVVILARGGGSLEDLWTFNEERVARTIAACSVPVISAVGHETDFTIADFVADCRAPTPSAAAEIVICTRESLLEQITADRTKLGQAIRYRILLSSRELRERGVDRASGLVHRALLQRAQRIDELEHDLTHRIRDSLANYSKLLRDVIERIQASDLRLRFARNRRRAESLDQRLQEQMRARCWDHRRRYESLQLRLEQLSPVAVLSRGYAIVQRASGQILRSASETAPGEDIRIRLHEGTLTATVMETEEPRR